MKVKTYNTIATKEMYEKYTTAFSKEEFIIDFLEKEKGNGVTTKEDFFSLLLSKAIQQKDIKLVEDILGQNSKDSYPSILTNVDQKQMSPISYALLLDEDGSIQNLIKDSINHGHYFQKVILTKESFLKMYDIISYQGESYQDCINDLIKPIVIEEEVKMLGEPTIDNIDLSVF